MEFRQLRYFVEIARRGSFVQAAGGLGLTQPALSRQMDRLAREMGTSLFERVGRHMRLTPAGERLLEHALQITDLWHETLEVVRAVDGDPQLIGEISVSTGGTVAAYLLPQALQRMRRDHPEATFRVFEGDAQQTYEAVRSGEADLGILTGPIEGDVNRRPFVSDHIVPIVSKSSPLARKRRLVMADLKDRDFVMFHPASAIRRTVEQQLRRLRFRPRIAMELRSVESVLRAVQANLGIGFISRFALGGRVAPLRIADFDAQREFYFCFRRARPALAVLMDALLTTATRQSM